MTDLHGTGTRPHVVVIGGGFGGLSAVRALRTADVDVTLVDRHAYNTFQPLLYQVATGTLNPGDVTWFLRSVRSKQKNVRFVQGSCEEIDHEARTVKLSGGEVVQFDRLVIATGVAANYFGTPGAEKSAMPLYTRTEALALRDAVFSGLEEASVNRQYDDIRVVIVGGGPTGVETAGALAEMRNKDIPVLYPELDPNKVHVTLVEMSPHLLAPFEYKDKGILATIGRASAVAEVKGLPTLRGFPAWVIWNSVHIVTLLGNRNRVSAMVNLGAKYLAWGRTHNAIVGDTKPPRLDTSTAE
jgi:NADH dehydrogenase